MHCIALLLYRSLPGHDFCAEGHSRNCVENSDCINLEAGAFCSCKEGYHALRDDSAYCQGIKIPTGKHANH